MLPGIPSKKANFKCFSAERYFDVFVVGKKMYALYSHADMPNQGAPSFLKCIDLDSFDGDFDSQPCCYEANVTGLRSICPGSNVLMISGWKPEVLSLDGFSSIYSEADRKLNPEWDDYGWVYYWGGKVYRGSDVSSLYKGIDIIDIKEQRVSSYLRLDIDYSKDWQGSLIFGERRSGNFLVYCLDRGMPVLDVSLAKYRQAFPEKSAIAFIEANLVYVLIADHLLVFDLVTAELVREVNYFKYPAMQAHMHAESMDANWACAGRLSVCNGEVVLSHGGVGGYSLYLAPFRDEPFVWLWSAGRGVVAKNQPGDLVFGLSGSIPIAWDKYTGEVVWDTKKPTATSKIAVGDQWVVFSQTAEYIQGHHWKKPYISLHRPAEE
ncbi:hypothetical protein [Atopomonas hussainii]|uniref:hypothetical protein n=1 Tax=Atopomonas hussainii TaxID=1429083 RepID=UPI0008FFFEB0|nr:hypothetical protein [Atopomonas hussainii]